MSHHQYEENPQTSSISSAISSGYLHTRAQSQVHPEREPKFEEQRGRRPYHATSPIITASAKQSSGTQPEELQALRASRIALHGHDLLGYDNAADSRTLNTMSAAVYQHHINPAQLRMLDADRPYFDRSTVRKLQESSRDSPIKYSHNTEQNQPSKSEFPLNYGQKRDHSVQEGNNRRGSSTERSRSSYERRNRSAQSDKSSNHDRETRNGHSRRVRSRSSNSYSSSEHRRERDKATATNNKERNHRSAWSNPQASRVRQRSSSHSSDESYHSGSTWSR